MKMSLSDDALTLRIRGTEASVRGPDVWKVLTSGMPLAITPLQGVWCVGVYKYEANHIDEHSWESDAWHFVGLVDGMRVQVEVPS